MKKLIILFAAMALAVSAVAQDGKAPASGFWQQKNVKVKKVKEKQVKVKPVKEKKVKTTKIKSNSTKSKKVKTSKVKPSKVKSNNTRLSPDGQMNFIVDAFGGYSNFRCKEVSPKMGVGFGGDIGLQCDYSRLFGKMPKGLYLEADIGYACKGSGAYPIHYAGAKVFPIGYRHAINPTMNIVGRVGGYVAYPFSEIKTKNKNYSTNLDFGLSAGIGIEWKLFGVMATYEHGFADVKDGGAVKLYNQGAFLTVSYKLSTF